MIVDIEVVPRPLGTSANQYAHVEAAIALAQSSGLHYEVNALGTTIEGPPDDVWSLHSPDARVLPRVGRRARHHRAEDRATRRRGGGADDGRPHREVPHVNTVGRRARSAVPPVVFFALVLVGWEVYVRARGVADYVLPPPSKIWSALVDMAPHLGPDIRATLIEATVGLVVAAVAGAAFAVLIAVWPFARRAVYPLLVVSQTIPAIVLAPIFVVWLGFGLLPKVVVVALIGFFPIVVSSVDGLVNADPERIDLVRSFGGGRLQRLRLVQVPSALPAFFAGMKIAATYAVVGAVIGEWMGTSQGLGLVMTRASRAYRLDRVLAAVVIVALVSLVLFALVSVLARVATPWTASSATTSGTETS